MKTIGLLEKSNAFQFAILSTKVAQLLKKIESGATLNDQEYNTLSRGAHLLKQIIEGSILIERKGTMDGFSASQEGLSAYGHALSAIEILKLVSKEKDFTKLFVSLYNEMIVLTRKEHLEKDVLEKLEEFFNVLSKLFSKDIQKDIFGKPREQTPALLTNRSIHRAIA